jgi:hypothetical protein
MLKIIWDLKFSNINSKFSYCYSTPAVFHILLIITIKAASVAIKSHEHSIPIL